MDFSTEALTLVSSIPEDGDTAVALTDLSADKFLQLDFNVLLAPSAELAFELTENGVPRPIEVHVSQIRRRIVITIRDGLVAGASYELSFGSSLLDLFGGAYPDETTISFTAAP